MARDVEFQEHEVGGWRRVSRRPISPYALWGSGTPWTPVEFGYYPPADAQRAAKLLSEYLTDSGMGPNFWGEAVPDESGGASIVLEVRFATSTVQGKTLLPKQAFALARLMADKFAQASGWTVSVQWAHTR
jgi:hypothetical protein